MIRRGSLCFFPQCFERALIQKNGSRPDCRENDSPCSVPHVAGLALGLWFQGLQGRAFPDPHGN